MSCLRSRHTRWNCAVGWLLELPQHLQPQTTSDSCWHASPPAGFYFVSKLMVRDLARVKLEYAQGETGVSALFATALAADVLDLAAQLTVISG